MGWLIPMGVRRAFSSGRSRRPYAGQTGQLCRSSHKHCGSPWHHRFPGRWSVAPTVARHACCCLAPPLCALDEGRRNFHWDERWPTHDWCGKTRPVQCKGQGPRRRLGTLISGQRRLVLGSKADSPLPAQRSVQAGVAKTNSVSAVTQFAANQTNGRQGCSEEQHRGAAIWNSWCLRIEKVVMGGICICHYRD